MKKLVTGRAAFVDDLAPLGLLHAALVASPHPHARITGIDASAARALPGVVDVITHEGDSWSTPDAPRLHSGLVLSGVVRFVGAPAAIVVAEDPEIAGRAAEAVRVAYDPLPAVHWTPGEAGKAAPVARVEVASGDVARAFREADRIVEVVQHFDRSRLLPPEPPAALAWLDENGRLVVRSASASPLRLRLALVDALGVAGGRIHVERPEVGGDFGARGGVLLEVVCGLVTLRTGRPCRFALRPDHPAGSFDRGACSVKARAALLRGALRGVEIHLVQEIGQAPANPDVEAELRRAAACMEIYAIPALRFEAEAVVTHGPPAGGSAAIAAGVTLEALVDETADAIGEEPLALRRRLLADTAPRSGLRASLEVCRRGAGRRSKPGALGARRGLGMALARAPLSGADAAATVARNEDGSFTVSWSPCDGSTSASDALEALAARSLGVPVPSVTVNLSLHAEPPASGVADLWITARAVESAGDQMAAKIEAKGAKGRGGLVVSTSHRADQAPVPAGAFMAEVDVDPQTGVVTLVRLVQALGAGATEPLIAARAEGDALRGTGFVLFERAAGPSAGRARVRTVDLPAMRTLLGRGGRPSPLGRAPIGDVAFLGAAAAVANAVAQACGVRIRELPLTPDRVLEALEGRR